MLVPNRHGSSNSYRHGFQGQEKDNEIKGEGNSLNYTFRMHDPRVGRFFATDPLEFKFQHNSPYAFSENKVINSVELEGLEHATIIYKYYYGSKKPVFEVQWYNKVQHNTYGSLGRGIAFRYEKYDEKKNLTHTSATTFHERTGVANHGFYYGPQQMPNVYLIDNYLFEPIDAVDNAARSHDMAYDSVGATAEYPNSWAAIEADKSLVNSCTNVHELYLKRINDPYNNQPITKMENTKAINASLYFGFKVSSQIDEVSRFMESNYPNITKDASKEWYFEDDKEGQKSNYILFRNMYMQKNDDGAWEQNPKMWKTNKDGEYIPKTSKELQTN